MKKPYLIHFPKIGDSAIGYISVAENNSNIPFDIKRVFWTYFTPEEINRGGHAHHNTEMILIAVSGKIILSTECMGEMNRFELDKPNFGVYLPTYCWHHMIYSHNSIQLVLASGLYSERDYIRNYDEFKSLDK